MKRGPGVFGIGHHARAVGQGLGHDKSRDVLGETIVERGNSRAVLRNAFDCGNHLVIQLDIHAIDAFAVNLVMAVAARFLGVADLGPVFGGLQDGLGRHRDLRSGGDKLTDLALFARA